MNQAALGGLMKAFKRMFGWLAFLCQTLAFSAEVFLHQWFGPKYIGAQAIAAPLIMLAYALLWIECNLVPLFVFLAAYLVMCGAALIGVRRAKRSCDQLPDRYSGYPRMTKTLGFTLSGRWIKRIVEPVCVALIGWATKRFDESLGVYLMIVAAGLFLSVNGEWVCSHYRSRERAHDPDKPRPIRVQVRRIPREQAERFSASRPNPAYGGRS